MGSTKASALLTPLNLPAASLRPPYLHGRPGPPTAALVGGGVSGDRSDPQQALCDPRGSFPGISQEWGGLPSDKRSGRFIHSFLTHILLGAELIPGIERVALIGVDLDGMVCLLHSLSYVKVDLYSTIWHIFAYWGDMTAKGLPPVVEIPH